jgi:drug/metabolite transporter (DMT)-like permease
MYALTNILLRRLAEDNDPVWVSCMKAAPTWLLALLVLGYEGWHGTLVLPSARSVLAIVSAALFVQVGGNLMWQWSLGVIGLALTVPVSFGTLITASALLGRVFLGEAITGRSLLSMSLLISSIAVLSFGAEETSSYLPASQASGGGQLVVLGLAAACIAGVAFALVAVVLRTAVRRISVAMTLFLISGTGVVALGLASWQRLGFEGLRNTEGISLLYMCMAGSFNAIGFFALGKSLQVISVVHANVLNASQAAIAVVTGILLFQEPATWPLMAGVVLSVAGLAVVKSDEPTIDVK